MRTFDAPLEGCPSPEIDRTSASKSELMSAKIH